MSHISVLISPGLHPCKRYPPSVGIVDRFQRPHSRCSLPYRINKLMTFLRAGGKPDAEVLLDGDFLILYTEPSKYFSVECRNSTHLRGHVTSMNPPSVRTSCHVRLRSPWHGLQVMHRSRRPFESASRKTSLMQPMLCSHSSFAVSIALTVLARTSCCNAKLF